MANRIQCLTCLDIIESRFGWESRWCKCKTVAVMGGREYSGRVGSPGSYAELGDTSHGNSPNSKTAEDDYRQNPPNMVMEQRTPRNKR
jgi:hypothetical protein